MFFHRVVLEHKAPISLPPAEIQTKAPSIQK